jgi:hypothetical protein
VEVKARVVYHSMHYQGMLAVVSVGYEVCVEYEKVVHGMICQGV